LYYLNNAFYFQILYFLKNSNLGGILILAALVGSGYSFFLGSLVSDQEALTNINQVKNLFFKNSFSN